MSDDLIVHLCTLYHSPRASKAIIVWVDLPYSVHFGDGCIAWRCHLFSDVMRSWINFTIKSLLHDSKVLSGNHNSDSDFVTKLENDSSLFNLSYCTDLFGMTGNS